MDFSDTQISYLKSKRQSAYGMIIALYWIPTVLFTIYAASWVPTKGWNILSLGWLLACAGSVCLILLFQSRERPGPQPSKTQNSESDSPDVPPGPSEFFPRTLTAKVSGGSEVESLTAQLEQTEHRLEELGSILAEKDEKIGLLQAELERQKIELERHHNTGVGSREEVEAALSERDAQIEEYQQTIYEQRSLLEKKQHQISKLENKARDLTYEVKTLLQLGEMGAETASTTSGEEKGAHPLIDVFNRDEDQEVEGLLENLASSADKQVLTPYDASVQLNRCIEIASNLAGANHLASEGSRFLDLSIDSYAIDLRRLLDRFRTENTSIILLYSKKERRLLFSNEQLKELVGWGVEKFCKDFFSLIQEGSKDWNQAVEELEPLQEKAVRLLMKTKAGENILVHCRLGLIPSGVFQDHVIAVLYPA